MARRYASVHKGLERARIDEWALNDLLVKQAETQGELRVASYAIYSLYHTPRVPRHQRRCRAPRRPTMHDRRFKLDDARSLGKPDEVLTLGDGSEGDTIKIAVFNHGPAPSHLAPPSDRSP
jgi:hypothetical protein